MKSKSKKKPPRDIKNRFVSMGKADKIHRWLSGYFGLPVSALTYRKRLDELADMSPFRERRFHMVGLLPLEIEDHYGLNLTDGQHERLTTAASTVERVIRLIKVAIKEAPKCGAQ